MRSYIKVAAGASQGRAHENEGLPCQDKTATFRSSDKKSGGIAVADGSGSSLHSQFGAHAAVSIILPFIETRFNFFYHNPSKAREIIIQFIIEKLQSIALGKSCDLNDLASTLMFVYVQRSKKSIRFIAGNIGDGVIAMAENKQINAISLPSKGEFANTTYFLTSPEAKSFLKIYTGILPIPIGFILMTDGAAETLYMKKTARLNQAFCNQMLNWFDRYSQEKINKLVKTNLEKGIFKEVTYDDCGIAILKVT